MPNSSCTFWFDAREIVENFKKSLMAPSKDPDDNDDERNGAPKGVDLKVQTNYVMFDPQFFDEIKKTEKSASFLQVINETSDNVKASMKAEDLKRSVRKYCNVGPKYFDLLGIKRNFDDSEHARQYQQFVKKYVSL